MAKILMVASHGGHYVQLCKAEYFLKSRNGEGELETVKVSTNTSLLESGMVDYVVDDFNANSLGVALKVLWCSLKILISEKPSLVISTGALPGLMFCISARLLNIKTVWIDSVANYDELSKSGKAARYIVSVCCTQWPHLSMKYRRLKFVGRVL